MKSGKYAINKMYNIVWDMHDVNSCDESDR